MNLKSATLLGLIGAIIGLVCDFINIARNVLDAIAHEITIQLLEIFVWFLCPLFSAITLCLFFYVLYKNQK